jgi:hypothetical protein
MFDPGNPETYPPELKRWHAKATRAGNNAKAIYAPIDIFSPTYNRDMSRAEHSAIWTAHTKRERLAFSLAYMAVVTAANLQADAEQYESYITLMRQANTYYNKVIRSFDRDHLHSTENDFVMLGGRLKESVANKRLNAQKYAADPMSKPLSYKPFTAQFENGRTYPVKAAIIGAYAFSDTIGSWWIFHADTGLPFARTVYTPNGWKAKENGCTKRIYTKKRAHEQIRPLAAQLPDLAALREYGFRLTDGNGNATE